MRNHYQVLILGVGNAGISDVAQLLQKKSSLKIGIVDPCEKHYYQPAWTLNGAEKVLAVLANQTRKAEYRLQYVSYSSPIW